MRVHLLDESQAVLVRFLKAFEFGLEFLIKFGEAFEIRSVFVIIPLKPSEFGLKLLFDVGDDLRKPALADFKDISGASINTGALLQHFGVKV